jgi:hypothetical protein
MQLVATKISPSLDESRRHQYFVGMAQRTSGVHVATTTCVYKGRVHQIHLLRRTYREESKIEHQILGNLSLSLGASKPATYRRLSALQNQPPLAGCYSSQFNTAQWISGTD